MTEEEAIARCIEQGYCKSIETNNESDNFLSKLFSADKTDTDTWLIRIGCLLGLVGIIAIFFLSVRALAQYLA